MQCLQDADGGRESQTDYASGTVPGSRLRADAANSAALDSADSRAGVTMMVCVRLFARARDLAGTDRLKIQLAGQATGRDVRRGLVEACPALAGILERS